MAKHELVCVREYSVEVGALTIQMETFHGVKDGAPVEVAPARVDTYRVGQRATFSRKGDADRWIKTGNWARA